ncbi:MAG: sulfotransferase family 2 domain-containing protein [Novosphingobium sp.]|nr:sulfotransferase family 2 domain-containing protein [Novosphingobium sp.]
MPEVTLERARARRRRHAFRRAGIVFIHVPRAAGTSVAETIYGGFLGHFTIDQVLRTNPEDVLALPRFTIVRNPWDRAVSAFEFARAGGGIGDGSRRVRIAHPERYRGPTFSAFDRFVREFLATHEIERLDGVFRPQLYYVGSAGGTIPFDHIGRFDRLGETEQWLSDTLQRSIRFPRLNPTERLGYREYYTPELQRIVGDIYESGVKSFGFDF